MRIKWKSGAAGFASALLAVCLMATPALAETRHGRGEGRMLHKPDGAQYPTSSLTQKEHSLFMDWEEALYGSRQPTLSSDQVSVLNIAVGETVVLHAAQETISYDADAGARTLYLSSYWQGVDPHISIKTVAGIDNLSDSTRGDMFHVSSGNQDYYCLEWSITGVTEGVDYLWYFDNPFPPQYLKIVVGSGKSAENTSSSSKSSESPSGNSSTTTGNTSSSSTSSSDTSSKASVKTTSNGTVYTVQSGDTLATIALNYYGNHTLWPQLQEVNRSSLAKTSEGIIYAGFGLHLPDTLGGARRIDPPSPKSGETLYTVQAGDTLGLIALEHYGAMKRCYDIYNRNSDRLINIHTLYEGQVIVLP